MALLEGALRARPGNLTLLMELGNSYPANRPEGAVERMRWFQAALAAHFQVPASHAFVKALSALVSGPPRLDIYESTLVQV
jgi:hypothetical protein